MGRGTARRARTATGFRQYDEHLLFFFNKTGWILQSTTTAAMKVLVFTAIPNRYLKKATLDAWGDME